MEDFNTDESSSPCGTSNGSGDMVAPFQCGRQKKRAGRTKFREMRHPVYWGVRKRGSDKWVCEIREPNKKTRIWLGTYPTPDMAARAHDVAALALRGKSASLNFPDSAWRLPVPESGSTKDIQKAAAQAAEAFHPSESIKVGKQEAEAENSSATGMKEAADKDTPRMLADIAEGLLLYPPGQSPSEAGEGGGLWNEWDEGGEADLLLWNY
ncbi:dehydration-responsive element-binding protein 1D-like [Aristolochia californica]|uniref:dehydration-responsive element-binding protein 1D-like n=1 Tax=Aristolochia californica TaxID=171875 RepID=UPI0035E0E75D